MESELPILLYLFSHVPAPAKDKARAFNACQAIESSDTAIQHHQSPKPLKSS